MSLKGTVWVPIGPSPIAENTTRDNGLVSTIAINPNNPNVAYIGTAGGGIWRSRDAGNNWLPLFDRQPAIGIGEPGGLAIDPSNTDIVYAGTSQRLLLGDVNPTFFNAPNPSQGLFKSFDAGNSWIQLGAGFPAGNTGNALTTFLNNDINVVLVDPANGNNLYVGARNGVWISTDGGLTWTAGTNTTGNDVRSLVLDPSSPTNARILYAGLSGNGVSTSVDGGATWNSILTGSTPAVATAIGSPSHGFAKVVVALAPPTKPTPNPGGIQVIYATLEGTGAGVNDPLGVFLSTNQGATWTQRTATNMPTRTQSGYSFHMAIDPASPGDGANDIIYFGTVTQARSTNSGASFTQLDPTGSQLHADTHAWAFVPQPIPTPSIAYIGSDGGIFQSVDNGTNWTPKNAGGLQTGLFYNIDVKPDAAADVIVGALQDNAVLTTKGSSGLGWQDTNGGDGWDVAYDGVIANQVYCSSGYWSAAPGNPPVPCTEVFRSTNDGATFASGGTGITPWTTATDAGCYLAPIATDPSKGGVLYVSGSQNLWQSQDGGNTWRAIGSFTGTGDVDVAPANSNNVIIAVGADVFVSTNALATTGVAFTKITRNLPGRSVIRARFDPADPTVIYAVLGGIVPLFGKRGHVFRTTIAGTAWTDISPTVALNEPVNVPFTALALDGTEVPSTIYAGTDFGVLRSVDAGKSWSILDDLHFPRVQVADLVFNPIAGVLVAATYGRGAFKFTKPTGPAMAIALQDNLDFGTICSGPQYLTITVSNVGVADLVISSVQPLVGSSDFSVLATPGTPLTVSPGEEITFTLRFLPSSAGVSETAIIRIVTNDPGARFVDVAAVGTKGNGRLVTAIADAGNFGNVCLGAFADEPLVINNAGPCPLSISAITSTSTEFEAPSVAAFALVVAAGASLAVPIRFQPASLGTRNGTLRIVSDDPASPHTVAVTGTVPAPRLTLAIADGGAFGSCCVGSFVDEPLLLSNSGGCTLTVTSITSSDHGFLVPEVLSFPLKIEAGDALSVPLRFQPVGLGAKSATITVTSDDPTGQSTISVTGIAPPGKLAVAGSSVFGSVKCCRREQRRISICNVGTCPLHVSRVALKRHHRHFRVINNPFPATLQPGSCLDVVIQYHAVERVARVRELLIESDDPDEPVRCVDLIAWTSWECDDECKCEHRRECRSERCNEGHEHGDHDEDDDEERDDD